MNHWTIVGMSEHKDRNDSSTPDEGKMPEGQIGQATVSADHYLCWTPCHSRPIRVPTAPFEPWIPVAAICPRCGVLWTVELLDAASGPPHYALWRRLGDETR
jgi:hypothetical protein